MIVNHPTEINTQIRYTVTMLIQVPSYNWKRKVLLSSLQDNKNHNHYDQ